MKKNVRLKVREDCRGIWWDVCIYKNRKLLMINKKIWRYKSVAIRNAKAMAKRIGIPYDPEIIKEHGC